MSKSKIAFHAYLFSMVIFSGCTASIGDGSVGEESGADGSGSDENGQDAETDGDFGSTEGDPGLAAETDSCNKMDILFVIDDSGSMREEQSNLSANFPQFANVINSFTTELGRPIDYRLAVSTTGVSRDLSFAGRGGGDAERQFGADGALQGSDCATSRPWLERRDQNIEDTFTCMANVGINWPGVEMPLEAVRLAIQDRVSDGSNANFFREDALLGVVFLTDENDCSWRETNGNYIGGDSIQGFCDTRPESIHTYIDALDTFKEDRGRWATAVIAGLSDCSSELGDASRATRLLDFAQQTGDNAVTSSICEGDLSTALEEALQTFDAACDNFPPLE